MRQQIQMHKLIKNYTVYLCGKSETNFISRAYITYKKQVRNTFIVGTNY